MSNKLQLTEKIKKINKRVEQLTELEKMATKIFGKLGDDFKYRIENREVLSNHPTVKKFEPILRLYKIGCQHTIDFDFVYKPGEIWVSRTKLQTPIGEVTRAIVKFENENFLKLDESVFEMFSNVIKCWFAMDNIETDQFYEIFKEEFGDFFEK